MDQDSIQKLMKIKALLAAQNGNVVGPQQFDKSFNGGDVSLAQALQNAKMSLGLAPAPKNTTQTVEEAMDGVKPQPVAPKAYPPGEFTSPEDAADYAEQAAKEKPITDDDYNKVMAKLMLQQEQLAGQKAKTGMAKGGLVKGYDDGGPVTPSTPGNLSDLDDDQLKALLNKTSDSVSDTSDADKNVSAPGATQWQQFLDQATGGQYGKPASQDQIDGAKNGLSDFFDKFLGQATSDHKTLDQQNTTDAPLPQSAPVAPAPDSSRSVASNDDDTDTVSTKASAPKQSPAPNLPAALQQSPEQPAQDNSPFNLAALKAAQAQQQQLTGISGIGRALGTIGSAISRGNYKNDTGFFDDFNKNVAAKPVNNLLQQEQVSTAGTEDQLKKYALADEKERNDPTKPVSQLAQTLLTSQMKQLGYPIPAGIQNMSASSIEKAFPTIGKILDTQENAKMRQTLGEQNLLMRQQVFQQGINNREQSRYNSTVQQLEQTRSSPAVRQAELDMYNAQKANTLANLYGDPNKLNPQMVKLLQTELSKIASGGVPSMEELKGLDPATLNQHLAGIWQKFSNAPTAANAGAFVKQYQDYANGLTKDAQNIITDRYGRIINAKNSDLSPEHQKALQEQYINRFKNESASRTPQSQGSLSPQDQQAISWAQANPTDPRAAKILALHGMK